MFKLTQLLWLSNTKFGQQFTALVEVERRFKRYRFEIAFNSYDVDLVRTIHRMSSNSSIEDRYLNTLPNNCFILPFIRSTIKEIRELPNGHYVNSYKLNQTEQR
jgi:hypothetical protein